LLSRTLKIKQRSIFTLSLHLHFNFRLRYNADLGI
jgi:hypothetical protein